MRHIGARSLLRLAVSALLFLTACASPTSPAEAILTLEIASSRVSCTGLFPTECLQVRERADAPWERFYEPIDGFTYEPGYRYLLRVARRAVPNPPADGAGAVYRLLAVLSKVAE